MIELLMSILISFNAVAAAENPLMTAEEKQIQEKARKRDYPGGRDEDRLKVQSQLTQAQRKMAPATEASQAQSESGED